MSTHTFWSRAVFYQKGEHRQYAWLRGKRQVATSVAVDDKDVAAFRELQGGGDSRVGV